jgi:gliding motility-associated-like protein
LYVYANELCNFVQSYADPNYHSPVTRIPSLDSPFRVCQQAPLSITFKQAANAKQLSWDFGDGSPTLVTLSLSDTTQTHNYLRAGKYTITAIASYGCLSDTSKATVTVDSLPVVSLPLDSLVDVCKPLVLDAGAGFANYRWQDGDTSETHTVSGPGKYSVTVTNACGRATGSLTIKKADVVAPNVFTPNNDGANEYFWLPNMDVLDRKLTVLNRYGEQVYTSQHYHNEWKAEGVPDGMYYYFFTYPGCDTAKGYVQVIR